MLSVFSKCAVACGVSGVLAYPTQTYSDPRLTPGHVKYGKPWTLAEWRVYAREMATNGTVMSHDEERTGEEIMGVLKCKSSHLTCQYTRKGTFLDNTEYYISTEESIADGTALSLPVGLDPENLDVNNDLYARATNTEGIEDVPFPQPAADYRHATIKVPDLQCRRLDPECWLSGVVPLDVIKGERTSCTQTKPWCDGMIAEHKCCRTAIRDHGSSKYGGPTWLYKQPAAGSQLCTQAKLADGTCKVFGN